MVFGKDVLVELNKYDRDKRKAGVVLVNGDDARISSKCAPSGIGTTQETRRPMIATFTNAPK